MCRLFGFRSAVPSRAHRSLTEAENALAKQSENHPDGWGIGWFVDDDAYVVKSANAAHACERFQKISSALASHTMVVHVRKATVGHVDHLNAHPFRYGRWLFAHNGTLFEFERLRPWLDQFLDDGFRPQILGDTDSEHLFYYVLSALTDNGVDHSGRRPSEAATVGRILRQALLALDEECQRLGIHRPITNVLLTDGRCFVAHRAGMPLLMSTQKFFCAEFERCPEPSKVCMERVRPAGMPVNHLLVASERIAGSENAWEEIEDGTTVILDEHFRLEIVAPPEGWVAPELPPHLRKRLVDEPAAVSAR